MKYIQTQFTFFEVDPNQLAKYPRRVYWRDDVDYPAIRYGLRVGSACRLRQAADYLVYRSRLGHRIRAGRRVAARLYIVNGITVWWRA